MSRYLSFVANKWQLLTAIAASAGAADADKLLRTSSNGYLAIATGGTGAGAAAEARANLGVCEPVRANDTLTWHEASLTSIAATAYTTIFNISGSVDLLGGAAYGLNLGLRITIDGSVVINRTATIHGRDSMTAFAGVLWIPSCRASNGLKLELYNGSSIARDVGWRLATR